MSYAFVLCIAKMFKIHSPTTTYIAPDMTSKGFGSSMSLGRKLPERLWILSVSGFTLGLVGSRTAGQTTMGRVVSGDVARAVTPGCRALEFLWVGLYLRAIRTWATRQTANTPKVWESYSIATCCRSYSFHSVPWRATPPLAWRCYPLVGLLRTVQSGFTLPSLRWEPTPLSDFSWFQSSVV